MKVINPFDRFKDKSFKPRSLFPASKMTRTSLPIGRLVPLYYNEMMAGDKIKLKMSQLTRFMPMVRPVMQNYEFGVGAFFVPYRSLDRFTNPHPKYDWTTGGSNLTLAQYKSIALNAREFFNPDADPETRNHPLDFYANNLTCPPSGWSGSLFDHLQYYCPDGSSGDISVSMNNLYNDDVELEMVNIVDEMLHNAILNGVAKGTTPHYWNGFGSGTYFDSANNFFTVNLDDCTVSQSFNCAPFSLWLAINLSHHSDSSSLKDIQLDWFDDPVDTLSNYKSGDWRHFISNKEFELMVNMLALFRKVLIYWKLLRSYVLV